MTAHAAAVEGVRAWRQRVYPLLHGVSPELFSTAIESFDTLLRAYEDAALARDQLSAALSVRDHELTTLRAQHAALVKGLRDLHDLVESGLLVRNTLNDGHFPSYMAEAVKITKALADTQHLLATLGEPEAT